VIDAFIPSMAVNIPTNAIIPIAIIRQVRIARPILAFIESNAIRISCNIDMEA
jgi:hypothetical protein